jgi:hypothetical protein
MVMVLKEVQLTNVLTPVSTTRVCYSVAAQPIIKTHLEGEYKQQKKGKGRGTACKRKVKSAAK